MDNQQQTTEQEVLNYLKNNETFRNKIKESIERNIDVHFLTLKAANEKDFQELIKEVKRNISINKLHLVPDNIARFNTYLIHKIRNIETSKTQDLNNIENDRAQHLQDLNTVLELVRCAMQQVETNYIYKQLIYKVDISSFVDMIKEISTEIKTQLKLEQQRQQAHQEQDEIDNDLTKVFVDSYVKEHQEQDKIDNDLTLLGKIEDIKKYLIGKIQNNNDLYDIISYEINFVDEQSCTILDFYSHLNWQKDKRNKESRYNNESEEIKNRFNDMYSLFYYLNYGFGSNIQKICRSIKIADFMVMFKKLSNIVIREQKVLNDILNKLKNDRRFKRLTQNAELSERLFNNIENIKTNIQSNQDYKQHYSENGSYGFYKFLQDHQDANNNNDTAIQLLNIVFENIENNKNIELYKQINIKPFLDLINDVPVTGRWALKKIEESPRIQKYLIGRFGTNKDLYNNIKDEIKRINGQDMLVTEFCNHLVTERKSVADKLENIEKKLEKYDKSKDKKNKLEEKKQELKEEKKKINDMYSLFHNIVDQSPEVTNVKKCWAIRIIDFMDMLGKANQKAKQPEQQPQQQEHTQNQNVLPQQQNIQDTQNTNKKLKSKYNAVSGAGDKIQQELPTVQQQIDLQQLKSEYNATNGAINEAQQRLLTEQQQQINNAQPEDLVLGDDGIVCDFIASFDSISFSGDEHKQNQKQYQTKNIQQDNQMLFDNDTDKSSISDINDEYILLDNQSISEQIIGDFNNYTQSANSSSIGFD